jgi:hypothetical protein
MGGSARERKRERLWNGVMQNILFIALVVFPSMSGYEIVRICSGYQYGIFSKNLTEGHV